MNRRIGRLHVITDTSVQQRYGAAELAQLAIEGGADTIQYRSKSTDVRALVAEAASVRDICRAAGVLFLVNDRVDVCLAADADGVHLGREDMPLDVARRVLGPDRIIGGTIRGVEHLLEAEALGADYVGLGPIFGTSSKHVPLAPLGLDAVRAVAAVATIPIIGIAGISIANVASVIAAGADGVAVIGAVCAADDVAAAADAMRRAIDRAEHLRDRT
jgi:thiamine-phosphate pyrophosphorylase